MNILILSTHSPNYRAGLGSDVMTSLKNAGHKVDFICKTASEPLNSDFTCLVKDSLYKRIIKALLPNTLKKINKIKRCRKKTVTDLYPDLIINNGYEIHYLYEDKEENVTNRLLTEIKKDYDLVITLWWFSMLNSSTLNKIYDRLKCPIMILSIDMAPMTGGCFYFNNCRNFENECKNCPAMVNCGRERSIEERPHRNYLIKKYNYRNINCAFLGNSWMNQFAIASHLFDNSHIFKIGCIVDEHDFCPAPSFEVRKELGLEAKSLILFARSSVEPRKGCNYIINSIISLWHNMDEQQKNQFIIVTVGNEYIENGMRDYEIPCMNFSVVDRNKLIKLYQASTFFLSASVDDAGPSMVNQAIMCGCPVVCFDNGTAIDVIKDGISGFKAEKINQQSFNKALETAVSFFRTSEYDNIKKSTREQAIKTCSLGKFAKDIEKYFHIMKEKNNNSK